MSPDWDLFISFVRGLYGTEEFIPLHSPRFQGNEKKYLEECIDSTFVSSVGEFVSRFEEDCARFTGAEHAIATVNGTAALHVALRLAGVSRGHEVLTQALTFVATANAVSYTGAQPVFVDVDPDTMGLSPAALKDFLEKYADRSGDECRNTATGNIIKACLPMHTFGHPCRIDEICEICDHYNITVIEDAAESLGSFYKNRHTGTFGLMGLLSFNGNKTITCGGGGMILTDDPELAALAKHMTTTGKTPHPWEYHHDIVAYNYRLTNLSAALGCAQMEQLDQVLESKRRVADSYREFFENTGFRFFWEPANARSNFWLNSIILASKEERDEFLSFTNDNGVMTRPVWQLMSSLPMYKGCFAGSLDHSAHLADRVVNLPSSQL
ncbi:MAG: LegC family aminotransferase [Candidatus Krumholzibacteriota bacterium]